MDADEPTTPPTANGFIFDLPNEIQRPIFEYAAKLDGRCAFNLGQVARYVYLWIQPILYERIVVRSPRAASCLLRTFRSKPRGYFERITKSLAFDNSVTLQQAKPILAECSRRIFLLSLFRTSNAEDSFLKFVRSPFLRRLTLVFSEQDDQAPFLYRLAPYEMPFELLSSLTHLAIVIEYSHGPWMNLVLASQFSMNANITSYMNAQAAFQNLTHFAISSARFFAVVPIKKIAHNIRYFGVLAPCNLSQWGSDALIQSVRGTGDHSIVVLYDLGVADSWNVLDSFAPSEFWKTIEHLVDGGYISDKGEKW
ncbi:hypothetical protein GALMADRAFT_69601 [Galerina marginata CBS 339.88]|uniref:F-box domain-containing protein n=1 Tax=Galerina marginata (strain CBS 339.88) TaxID=685588 RepID=A0A067SVY0_GALM3|nr:hypothetical protein GALMADRAFT_69601 [Galerina marginata CBS 339.88]